VERLIVFNPAKVIADTVRNKESVKLTLRNGVAALQKITAEMRLVKMKYA